MKLYTVQNDLTADKSSDVYPTMTLCEDCVGSYTVINTEGSAEGPCEDCGCENESGSEVFCGECGNEFPQVPSEGDECEQCGQEWVED
ncbi:hypothetical protein [Vibrio harveyi]|uniref:hypothetical protein n=1 Tax=Vibrio harveyi TaxID=669 RepID=UPI00165DDB9A|nr:hypothetical protein [Vibrio harveyi]